MEVLKGRNRDRFKCHAINLGAGFAHVMLFKFLTVNLELQYKFCGGYKEGSKSWVDDKEKENFKEVQGGHGFCK